MEEKLFSIKDLSIRWQKDEATIRRYVKEGILYITVRRGGNGEIFTIRKKKA